jgi:2-amino-4-hydroxy-6-hydroxymethyldihydropteridine diphosphokinase
VAKVVLGLGSNLGDRLANLRHAASRIHGMTAILARSRVWESTPIGGPPQGAFLNAAVLVTWPGPGPWPATLEDLLDQLHAVESELGRLREVKDGPRTIDLDILWAEGSVRSARLTVPHPRLHERAFAVAPLLDVLPSALDPRTGSPYAIPAAQELRVFAPQV